MRRHDSGFGIDVKNNFRQFFTVQPQNRPAVGFQIADQRKPGIDFFNSFQIRRENQIMNAVNSFFFG